MPLLSPLGEIVRRHDPDRYFTALFAPADRRETLFTLYAFNHELARAREAATNPMAALIRLQWWREVAEGARRRHEVAGPLGDALDDGRLHAPDLLAMIDGREAEVEPIETLQAFKAYVLATAGGVAVAAGRALGGQDAALDALRHLGAGYGVAGILRNLPGLARQHRCLLPADLLAASGVREADVATDPAQPALGPVYKALAGFGWAALQAGQATRLPRNVLPAALPATLARRDLRAGTPGTAAVPRRGTADRLAILVAARRGAA